MSTTTVAKLFNCDHSAVILMRRKIARMTNNGFNWRLQTMALQCPKCKQVTRITVYAMTKESGATAELSCGCSTDDTEWIAAAIDRDTRAGFYKQMVRTTNSTKVLCPQCKGLTRLKSWRTDDEGRMTAELSCGCSTDYAEWIKLALQLDARVAWLKQMVHLGHFVRGILDLYASCPCPDCRLADNAVSLLIKPARPAIPEDELVAAVDALLSRISEAAAAGQESRN